MTDRATLETIIRHADTFGLPRLLLLAVAWNESRYDPQALGDGGTSGGLYQGHAPAHGGTAQDYMGLAGADRTAAIMRQRWVSTYERLGGKAAFDRDPAGFYHRYQPDAQGSDPITHEHATAAIAAARAVLAEYEQGATPVPPSVQPLFFDPVTGWYLPATPPVTGRWSPPGHYGIDIGGGGKRSPILSVTDGPVIYTGWWNRQGQPVNDRTGFGLTVMVRASGLVHVYGHNDEIGVSIGDAVQRGTQLAYMGNTGYVEAIGAGDGSHLHYAVYPGQDTSAVYNANAIDPTPWLELGAIRWRGVTIDGVRLRSLPTTTDPAGNDTTITVLPSGTPLFVPDGDDVRIPVVASGRRGWVSVPYVELEGTAQPPTPPAGREAEYRESAIRAWTHVRDGAAFSVETGQMGAAMAKETIATALAELRALGAL